MPAERERADDRVTVRERREWSVYVGFYTWIKIDIPVSVTNS